MHGWERVDSKKVGRKGVEGNGRRSGQEEWTGKKVGGVNRRWRKGWTGKGGEKSCKPEEFCRAWTRTRAEDDEPSHSQA